jgi:dTDP-4-dehydrorhamnose 3,5-epimerase
MTFHPTPLAGAMTIELEPRVDPRGFFARLFCRDEFTRAGIEPHYPQINTSFTARRGTLRGLHYQLPPAAETKVVRCLTGALLDVIVDLRPDSPSFLRSHTVTLSAENRTMLLVPRGFAHGFLTLTDAVEVLYLVSARYAPERERGLRWNDSALAIVWPSEPLDLSAKDAAWPDLDPDFHGLEALRGL